VRCTEMEPTEAEKLKARRIQRLLYVLMALMIGIPTVVFILQTFR
jgi:ABC-type phosphate transport system permease subunit